MVDKVFDQIMGEPIYGNPPDAGTLPLFVSFVCFCLICGTIMKIFIDRYNKALYYILVMLFSFGFGKVYSNFIKDEHEVIRVSSLTPSWMFKLLNPIMLNDAVFCLINVKFLSSSQLLYVLLISALFYIACLLGYVGLIFSVFSKCFDWKNTTLIILSFSVILYQPDDAILRLDNKGGHVRYLQALLKAEVLMDLVICFTVFDVVQKYDVLPLYEQSHHVTEIVESSVIQFCGVFVGLFYGVLAHLMYTYAFANWIMPLISLPMCYAAFSTAELIGTSGSVSVLMLSIFSNVLKKPKILPEHEELLSKTWMLVHVVTLTFFMVVLGLVLGAVDKGHDGRMFCFAFCIFVCSLIIRALFCFILLPYLYGDTTQWTEVALAVIGPYRGALSILNALRYAALDTDEGYHVLVLIYLLVLLSKFSNVVMLEWFMNRLDVFRLSKPQISSMTAAVDHINKCRSNMIFAEKLDRIVADANWSVVNNITRFNHPYKDRIKVSEFADVFKDDVKTVECPRCGAWLVAPPTKKELDELTRETKLRAIKAQQVSYLKQRDAGTLSLFGYKFLSNILYIVSYSTNISINIDDLCLTIDDSKFNKKVESFFQKLYSFTLDVFDWQPSNSFRLKCYRLVTSQSFKIVMALVSLIDMFLCLSFLYLYMTTARVVDGNTVWPFHVQLMSKIVSPMFPVLYLTNLVEAVIQILGLGLMQYFSRRVYIVEFFSCIIIRSLQFCLFVEQCFARKRYVDFLNCRSVIVFMNALMFLRVTRVYIFFVTMIPSLLSCTRDGINKDLLKKYDVGKAYLVGLDRVLKYLGQLATNEQVLDEIKKEVEENRKAVTKLLSVIQKDHPTIGITVKTKHAIRNVINVINECASNMQDEGILDSIEYQALSTSIERIRLRLQRLSVIVPPSPINIMKEVTWLIGDVTNTELFLEEAQMSSYDYNDVLIRNGDDPVGLYILVSGLLKAVYVPSPTSIQLAAKFGVLPNFDFFENFKFDQPQEDYIVSGNVVGELGVVTGRRYDMTVIAETAVQVFYIPWSTMKSLHENPAGQQLLEKIWKKIAVKISLTLLQFTTTYRHWTKERLLIFLQRGSIPKMTGFCAINLDQRVEEAVLVEGVALDVNDNAVIYGPYRVPKTVTKLLLPDHKLWRFQTVYETKLLIIPMPGVSINELLEVPDVTAEEPDSTGLTTKKSQKARKVGFMREEEED